jgi:hypothetical protein
MFLDKIISSPDLKILGITPVSLVMGDDSKELEDGLSGSIGIGEFSGKSSELDPLSSIY